MMRTSTAVFCTLASLTARELLLQARAVAVPDLDGSDAADQTTSTLPPVEPPPTVLVLDTAPWSAAAGLPVVDFAHTSLPDLPLPATVQVRDLEMIPAPSAQSDPEQTAVEWAIRAPYRPADPSPPPAAAIAPSPAVAQAPLTEEPPATVSFPDVQGHWAQEFIEPLAVRNIVQGFPDGLFRPDAPLTRAQFAALVRSAFRQPVTRDGPRFADVPDDYWATEAIATAYRMNFLDGYPQGQFKPEQAITRAEVLTALTAGLGASATRLAAIDLDEIYQDAAQIPAFAQRPVTEATENQWVVNYPNVTRLRPREFSTRAEAAAFVHQALVDQGVLPAIAASSPLREYIVSLEVPALLPPENPLEEVPPPEDLPEEPPLETDPDVLREQYRLPDAAPIFEAIAPPISRTLDSPAAQPQTPPSTQFGSDQDQEDWFSSVSFGGWGWLYGF
ncbi:MAG: S-layer homology domain-containing protein [Synechococcales bacterium]|nr:S-layer homology domain-containing protein [Synechococcales bacterium]